MHSGQMPWLNSAPECSLIYISNVFQEPLSSLIFLQEEQIGNTLSVFTSKPRRSCCSGWLHGWKRIVANSLSTPIKCHGKQSYQFRKGCVLKKSVTIAWELFEGLGRSTLTKVCRKGNRPFPGVQNTFEKYFGWIRIRQKMTCGLQD